MGMITVVASSHNRNICMFSIQSNMMPQNLKIAYPYTITIYVYIGSCYVSIATIVLLI